MQRRKRIRDYTWEDYGISKYRYGELKNFCLQYDEKKNKLRYGMKAVVNDGMPKGISCGNPTEEAAIDNVLNELDCKIIEEAAMKTDSSIWKYILKSVTKDLPYELIEYDEELGKITVCRTDFYGYRRLFFKNLHFLKNGYKMSEVP